MDNKLKNYFVLGATNEIDATATEKIHEVLDGENKESFKDAFNFWTVEEIQNYEYVEPFVVTMVGVAKETLRVEKKKGYNHIVINCVDGESDLFLWGIDVVIDDKDITYAFVDWSEDDIKYDVIGQ